MNQPTLFDGISPRELSEMLHCFGAARRSFEVGETIMTYSNDFDKIGVVVSGEADLVSYGLDGNRTILEHLITDSVFGEVFAISDANMNGAIIAECSKKCEIIFIDYEYIINHCQRACPCHNKLTDNLLRLMAFKAHHYTLRIEVLSRRSLRGKLMSYFDILSKQNDSDQVTIPFSMTSLADYLCIDRSAMLREMKKLREEGIIQSKGRQITIIKKYNV